MTDEQKIKNEATFDKCKRASLSERLAVHISRARRESRMLDHLQELQHLLEKNPDFARILELLQEAEL